MVGEGYENHEGIRTNQRMWLMVSIIKDETLTDEDVQTIHRVVRDAIPAGIPDRNVFCKDAPVGSDDETLCFVRVDREQITLQDMKDIRDSASTDFTGKPIRLHKLSVVNSKTVADFIPEITGGSMGQR